MHAETDLIENRYEVTVCVDLATTRLRAHYVAQVTLADQQADPNSPLFSVKTFEEVGL